MSTQINDCSLSVPALSVTIMTLQPGSKWDRRKADSACIKKSLQEHTSLGSKQHICVNTEENPLVRGAKHWNRNHRMQTTHINPYTLSVWHAHMFVISRRRSVCYALALIWFTCQKMLTHVCVCVTAACWNDVWWWAQTDDEKTRTEILLSDWISLVRVTENTQIVSADMDGHSHTRASTISRLWT